MVMRRAIDTFVHPYARDKMFLHATHRGAGPFLRKPPTPYWRRRARDAIAAQLKILEARVTVSLLPRALSKYVQDGSRPVIVHVETSGGGLSMSLPWSTKKGTRKMPTKKKAPAKKRAAAKRELIDTGTDKRYVRRRPDGTFKESDDVGKSLVADRRVKATTKSKKGQGDRGDR
jgi:hypothetical protein